MMYHSWDMEHDRQFFVILDRFLPFYPPMDPENQNFQKNGQNTWKYYHCTNINNNYMMYGSSDMECNRQNFLSFWTIFCPFTPNKSKSTQKTQKWKKHLELLLLYTLCTINKNHMLCSSWDMKHNRHNFLSFWTIFCAFIPLTTWKIKIWKNGKNT